jgi:hypothetical protein
MAEPVSIQTLLTYLTLISVPVGVFYHIMTLNNTKQNRRITLTTTLMQPFMRSEGSSDMMDLLFMDWSDLEDYKSKYDSRVNPENFRKRVAVWKHFNTIGLLYRKGFLDLETIEASSMTIIENLWRKFKPVMEMYRQSDLHETAYEHWEYLAEKISELYPETLRYDDEVLGFKKKDES